MKVIGISGGIGAGKSVLSRILRTRGYRVYDCDYKAKKLMDNSAVMIGAMQARWGIEIYDEIAGLNRGQISRLVFSDSAELEWLNSLVHKAVRDDLEQKISGGKGNGESEEYFFIESAILYSSGLYEICDEIWEVAAPERIRIERVKHRSGMKEEDIISRMRAQEDESRGLRECGIPIRQIDNGETLHLWDNLPWGDRN